MSHPQKALLDEFQYAIHHFVPTLPDEIKVEAQKVHDDLLADKTVDEAIIRRTFHDVGVKEYPYRHAYDELIHTKEEGKMNQLVLEHVDDAVRKVIEPHLNAGVHLDELVRSDLLTESLTPEQIYQVVDGIAVAKSKLGEAIKSHVSADTAAYDALLQKWNDHVKMIEGKLAELLELAKQGDEGQASEIKGKVQMYKEGFLVTEPDPDVKEIDEEIAYWKEAFAEEA
ncbi:hypothetical protein A3C09_04435 [Candidatus Uhrbacteria bacterium RIFCSPHIGHO2_02_FULL_47_44]|uniref:Uncharacterized protein n=1 Tax=Candidatus Uhrbacteria bacterium RIFCSPLOWO2_02_FULL_48_18 TaxID=1802408 RepID=A0A1F7VCL0_9BACT|nr:MAG: hypothetical protein A2839_02155 [Candidatus Uhrbacteria bacterium RIFCSPHIGHO2_01_FULL_47_10]OGL70153.1 MAG: hypothetical protein A3C09_04435 [Candidatus Uhrbacteria bacterium RIFCSPHIGHO2_02_FULL_47_44]OGL77836.1 MAG: hypothetical protein A3E97_02665 [Candidatus Uhrbacteria bacterium RIFCSPHIGHO2_12_FULL_47_12]OGL80656.1 MAG: hypothetical protein A3B20_04660 [Candidatus Uhrbacteria bacterium RIFCSPLOWO2_01_FULL_47_17]OGL88161.1 MAG: hypothetical protein A3I41_00320 [Candidatus Uhrbact